MTLRTRILTACTVLLLLGLVGRFAPGTPSTQDLAAWTTTPARRTPDESGWPRKIWQIWRGTIPDMGDELRWFAETWPKHNPDFRYEMMIDDQALTFVRESFVGRPDIIRTFENIRDSTIRADYTRYLIVLAEGGVYADIDLSCEKPVDEWIPEIYRNETGLVVGVAYDARGGDVPENFMPVQLCQWAFMAKKRNAVMQHVVDRLTLSIEQYLKPGRNPWEGPTVADMTHAKVFTKSVLEALTAQLRRPVTAQDIADLEEPKLIGDVLFMPVSSFASGQSHSGSREWGNDQELVAHHWKGFENWRHMLAADE